MATRILTSSLAKIAGLPAVAALVLVSGCASRGEIVSYGSFAAAREMKGFEAASSRVGLPELGDGSTLDDYLLYAVMNNPGLEAAFNRWRASLQQIPQAGALADPNLQFTQFIQPIETRQGPMERRFALSQKFPWPGKLKLQAGMAADAANAARQRYEAERLALFRAVTDAFSEYYYLGRAITVVEDNRKLVAYLEGVARANLTAGRGTNADLVRAQVELGQLEDRVATLRDLRTPLAARLNAALNRPTQAPLPFPRTLPAVEADLSEADLFDALRQKNPDLAAADFEIERQRKAIDRAKKDFYPDISVGLDYTQIGSASMPVDGSGEDALGVMLSLNLPIRRSKYNAGVKEALARQIAAARDRLNSENELTAALQLALYNYRDAARKVNLYRDTLVPKARQNLGVNQQAYTAGKAGFIDLIDAERSLLEFQLAAERAAADRVSHMAEIRKLTGGAMNDER